MFITHNDFDRIYHLLNSTWKFRVQIPYRKTAEIGTSFSKFDSHYYQKYDNNIGIRT